MKNKVISINESDVTTEAVLYTCFGVGSCIALFLNDRMTGLAGGAHIPIAQDDKSDLLSTRAMLDQLLIKFRSKGSNLNFLRAKIAVGADMAQSVNGPASENIQAIHKELTSRKIYIAAEDIGGSSPRTARFNTRTGELIISSNERSRLTL